MTSLSPSSMTSLAATAAAKLSNGLSGHHSNGSALPGGGSHHQNGDLEYMEKMDAGLDEKRTGGKASNVGGLPRGGGGGDASKRSRDASKIATKEDQVVKLELDLKKLKVDLQVARNKENELRDQIVSSAASKNYFSNTGSPRYPFQMIPIKMERMYIEIDVKRGPNKK